MSWGLAIAAGLWVAGRIYRELNPDPKPTPWNEVQLPRTEAGAPIPLIYGKCRVRAPVLAWTSEPRATDDEIYSGLRAGAPFLYGLNFFWVIGIPFPNGLNKIWRVFAGDDELKMPTPSDAVPLSSLTGAGENENGSKKPIVDINREDDGIPYVGGRVEFLDGRLSQRLHDGFTAKTKAASAMTDSLTGTVSGFSQIPGYRGYMCALFYGNTIVFDDNSTLWIIGGSPTPPAFQFEVSSYPGTSDAFNVDDDANPAAVLLDLLTGTTGKLGLDPSLIDNASWASARTRFQEEGLGYSRAITEPKNAGELIEEILEQVAAVMYEDPRTGKICIKLIRPDFDPSQLKHITPSNCEGLEGFAAIGTTGAVNKVRVKFPNRDLSYRDDEAVAINQAVAFAEGTKEVVLEFPGCCTKAQAKKLASRELSALCRPLQKCTAIVNREFYATTPGEPVKLTWPAYGIDGRVFRVANVDRGTLENGRIRLDLIEDYFHVWRDQLHGYDPHDWGDLPPIEHADDPPAQ